MFNLIKLRNWYLKNISKLVLLFIAVVIVTILVAYIPYVNLIISSARGMLIIFLCFYVLFPFSTRTLVMTSIGIIFFAFIFTLVELDYFAEMLGNLLYLLLIFIFINYMKDLIKNKTNL